jgi:hypothetical protein
MINKLIFPLIPFLFLFFYSSPGHSQKVVQLEKRGSFKTQKFYIGEILVYKLKSDQKQWLDERIVNIHIEDRLVQFEHRAVYIDSISAIRMPGGPGFRVAHLVLKTFGYSWYFWTLVSLAYGESLTVSKVAIGGSSLLAAWFLKQLFFKTHRLGKAKRLRLIDLTYYPIPPGGNNR